MQLFLKKYVIGYTFLFHSSFNNVLFLHLIYTTISLTLPEMNKFKVIQPSASLTPYVKQYWFLAMENVTLCSQRLVPLGCTALCFHRGNRIYSSSNGDYLPQSYLYGIATDYTNLAFQDILISSALFFSQQALRHSLKLRFMKQITVISRLIYWTILNYLNSNNSWTMQQTIYNASVLSSTSFFFVYHNPTITKTNE